MLKIRLRRTGAKFQPTYRLVVADSRAPRDGAFVANLGFYNPRAEPPTITVDEAALREWIRKGAQPTDSVLSVLRTGNVAPDLLARFAGRMIGAGGKRGAAADTPAPTAETPAETPAPDATPAATDSTEG
jgi:small subunit ribosomal protein S16